MLKDIELFERVNKLVDNCDEEKQNKLEELLPILYKFNYLNELFERGFDNRELNEIFANHRIEDMYIELKQLLYDILDN